jgi:hypothetical protein
MDYVETMNQTLHNGQTCQPTPIINNQVDDMNTSNISTGSNTSIVLSLHTISYRSGSSISDVGIDLSRCVSCRWIMCGWCVSIIVLSSFLLASLLRLRTCKKGHEGGGVINAVRKDTVCSGEDTLDTDCEIAWPKIQLKGCKALYTGELDLKYSFLSSVQLYIVVNSVPQLNLLQVGLFRLNSYGLI